MAFITLTSSHNEQPFIINTDYIVAVEQVGDEVIVEINGDSNISVGETIDQLREMLEAYN